MLSTNNTKQKTEGETMELFYAIALLIKLYKARVISRVVYEIAEVKCRERLYV
jgi:hypothetical protein